MEPSRNDANQPEAPASGLTTRFSNDEEVIDYHLQKVGNAERLTPEEEAFHSQAFFENREKLGALLGHFPRMIVTHIQKCKPPQIQEFDAQGNLDDSRIEEKKRRIISLVSAIETVADHLGRIAADSGESAGTTRSALMNSLEQLVLRFRFHYQFYTDLAAELEECATELNTGDSASELEQEVLLQPAAEFFTAYEKIKDLYAQMEASRTRLIEANLRLAINVARKYMRYGLSFQDLFQEGYLGMTVALDKFQPNRGHRFSTYAVWWIRQGITQALSSHSRTIRIPANMARLLTQIKRAEQNLLQAFGREPTDDEIAEQIGQSAARVRAWRKIEQQPISLESPIRGNEKSSISDLIVDASARQPDEVVSSQMLTQAIAEVLKTLNDREREIIEHRFGLMGKANMTLEELSRRFSVSHERIRQIEVAALKKLRSPERRKFFDGYY